ncbi:MAG: DNA repair protein RecO [Planctomycetes bacterium]|nr:DNA repair protein RecO [Planctomycetota bacterium]
MPYENALAIVIHTSDWSETSRIATMFTREFGKVRALAKGGRRLRSNFEVALDLLTVCSIVLLRKNSGLDLLTEARVEERFTRLRSSLPALYGGYYVAELLSEGTQDHDPHPSLFETALETLRALNDPAEDPATRTLRFELAWLHELGYRPRLDACAACGENAWLKTAMLVGFGPMAGGLVCPDCEKVQRDRRMISRSALMSLRELEAADATTPREVAPLPKAELRLLIGQYVTFVLGRRPKLLAYLE